jgi:hypothetical protein
MGTAAASAAARAATASAASSSKCSSNNSNAEAVATAEYNQDRELQVLESIAPRRKCLRGYTGKCPFFDNNFLIC